MKGIFTLLMVLFFSPFGARSQTNMTPSPQPFATQQKDLKPARAGGIAWLTTLKDAGLFCWTVISRRISLS
jgi:hypothetical protein